MPPTRILIVDDSPTIRKVVGAILSARNYECLTAVDGIDGLRILERQHVDLVLLDFVMPRMNGYKFCRELRANNRTKQLPVVLMSAKAEHIREQFIRQTGALDAITKPFDGRALAAVVEAAVRRASSGSAPDIPDAEQMAEEELLEDPVSDRTRASVLPPNDVHNQLQQFVSTVSTRLTEKLEEIIETAAERDDLVAQLRQGLTTETIGSIVEELAPASAAQTPNQVFSGNVKHIPLGEILQMLGMQQTTGTLAVILGDLRVEIALSNGRVDLAQTSPGAPEFLLGRYLVEEHLLDNDALAQAIQDAKKHGQLLGRWLLDNHIVTQEALHDALARQSSEIIYEVLRWRRGWFSLQRGELSPEATLAGLGLSVSSLILEGFRRVDEWRLIEQSIHFDDTLFRDEAAIGSTEPGDLTKQQQDLLKLIDGRRSVREVIDAAHQSSFDVCKTLYQLLQSRLVREFTENPH